MHIRESRIVPQPPAIVADAARAWLRNDAGDREREITEAAGADGSIAMACVIDESGIRITTRIAVQPSGAGSELSIDLRMVGLSLSDRLRNLTLLPTRGIVRRQVREQLATIAASCEEGRA